MNPPWDASATSPWGGLCTIETGTSNCIASDTGYHGKMFDGNAMQMRRGDMIAQVQTKDNRKEMMTVPHNSSPVEDNPGEAGEAGESSESSGTVDNTCSAATC